MASQEWVAKRDEEGTMEKYPKNGPTPKIDSIGIACVQ
jgi:hypothetical protein